MTARTMFSQSIATVFLGIIAVISIGGAVYLAAIDKALPGEAIAIGSAAGGALAALVRPGGDSSS